MASEPEHCAEKGVKLLQGRLPHDGALKCVAAKAMAQCKFKSDRTGETPALEQQRPRRPAKAGRYKIKTLPRTRFSAS
jgi:hypothetical protein